MGISLDLMLARFDDYMHFNGLINKKDTINDIREIYIRYDITADKETEYPRYKSEFAKRNAYLSAHKKVLKRKVVKVLAELLVNHFDIQETTIHFFHNLCKELMGRKVDNKFVISNFANRVKSGEDFVRLEYKRTASKKIKLPHSYKEMVDLSMYEGVISGRNMEHYTFRSCYNSVIGMVDGLFNYVSDEARRNAIPLDFIKIVMAKMEKEKLEKTVNESAKDNPDFYAKTEIKRL